MQIYVLSNLSFGEFREPEGPAETNGELVKTERGTFVIHGNLFVVLCTSVSGLKCFHPEGKKSQCDLNKRLRSFCLIETQASRHTVYVLQRTDNRLSCLQSAHNKLH